MINKLRVIDEDHLTKINQGRWLLCNIFAKIINNNRVNTYLGAIQLYMLFRSLLHKLQKKNNYFIYKGNKYLLYLTTTQLIQEEINK